MSSKRTKLFVLCGSLLLLRFISGCDPAVRYRFVIKNSSQHNFIATFSTSAFEDSSVVVESDSTKLLFEEITIGIPHELNDERFQEFLKSIKIYIDNRVVYTQAPADKTRWIYSEDARKNFFFGKIGKSIYTLDLNNSNLIENEPQK